MFHSAVPSIAAPGQSPPGFADPERSPLAATLAAARLLIAALDHGQNVDRLTRRTGAPRAFVARCARRLVDNGVWLDGQTHCDWRGERQLNPSFWKDVAVAEGKLCRRTLGDGSFEWAPNGAWTKSLDDDDDAEAVGVRYVEASVLPRDYGFELELQRRRELAEAESTPTAAAQRAPAAAPAPRPPAAAPPPPLPPAPPAPRPTVRNDQGAAKDVIRELFPDAHWLG